MNNDWVKVFSTTDTFKAEIIKQMLLSNDIEAVVMNQKDSSYHFGFAEIYTKEIHVSKAKKIISE